MRRWRASVGDDAGAVDVFGAEVSGQKLYEYARQGIDVPREARPITVYELLFIRHEGDELELEVHCSKGPIFAPSSMTSVKSWAAARM
jgi:hypothetical protein